LLKLNIQKDFSIKLLLIFATIFLLSGCSSTKNEPNYPQWYTKIHKDSPIYLHGLGESSSKKGAIAIALNEIASKITVSIESSYSSTTNVSGKNYNKSIQKTIKNSIKKIEFTNYKVLKEVVLSNNTYAVLVQVDRLDLAHSLEIKIADEIKSANTKLNSKFNNFTLKLKTMAKIQNSIPSIKSNIFILGTLDEMMDIKKYLSSINQINKKINKIKNMTTMSITNTTTSQNDYTKVLSSIITQKGFSVVKDNPDLHITVDTKEQEISSMGNKIIKANVEITIFNKSKTKVIGTKKFVTGGKSRANFSQAHEFSTRNFKDKILKENILSDILGI